MTNQISKENLLGLCFILSCCLFSSGCFSCCFGVDKKQRDIELHQAWIFPGENVNTSRILLLYLSAEVNYLPTTYFLKSIPLALITLQHSFCFLSRFLLLYLTRQCWNSSEFSLGLLIVNFFYRLYPLHNIRYCVSIQNASQFHTFIPIFLLTPRSQT